MGKKLRLDQICIQSFMTELTNPDIYTIKAGDNTKVKLSDNCDTNPKSRVLQCPSEGDPHNCGQTPTLDCTGFMTNIPAECDDLLN